MSNAESSGSNVHKAQTPMTQEAAARIQSADAKTKGGQTEKGSFAARAQSAAAQNGNSGANRGT